jgi:hypothetical protein
MSKMETVEQQDCLEEEVRKPILDERHAHFSTDTLITACASLPYCPLQTNTGNPNNVKSPRGYD